MRAAPGALHLRSHALPRFQAQQVVVELPRRRIPLALVAGQGAVKNELQFRQARRVGRQVLRQWGGGFRFQDALP